VLYWDKYNGKGHEPNIKGNRKYYDTNIYTFDIETSSYYILDGKVYPAIKYDDLEDNGDFEDLVKQLATKYNVYIGDIYDINEF
jgi:hypothetical protein